MGIAVKPLCSTEILFLSLTEMKQRLLSLPVENVLLIMGKEAADWWSLHSFLKEMEDRYQFHWLQTEVANPNQQECQGGVRKPWSQTAGCHRSHRRRQRHRFGKGYQCVL